MCPMNDPIIEGVLGVRRKSNTEPKYVVLYKDRLEYFTTEDDKTAGIEPRGQLILEDISEMRLENDGFVLKLVDGKELRFDAEAQKTDAWTETLKGVLGSEEGEVLDGGLDMGVPLTHGVLGLHKKGTVTDRFFVLTNEVFGYWDDQKNWAHSEPPRGCVVLEDVERFACHTQGFNVHVKGVTKPLRIRTYSKDDLERWSTRWVQVSNKDSKKMFDLDLEESVLHEGVPEEDELQTSTCEADGGDTGSSCSDPSIQRTAHYAGVEDVFLGESGAEDSAKESEVYQEEEDSDDFSSEAPEECMEYRQDGTKKKVIQKVEPTLQDHEFKECSPGLGVRGGSGDDVAVLRGALYIEGVRDMAECALYHDRFEAHASCETRIIKTDSIEEVDILEHGFTLRHRSSSTTFDLPSDSCVQLEEWLHSFKRIGLEKHNSKTEQADPFPCTRSSPRRASISNERPETVMLVPFSDRKLWEVFTRCGPDCRTGRIIESSLWKSCRESMLVMDFFGITDLDKGLRKMKTTLHKITLGNGFRGQIDWDDFKSFYEAWASSESHSCTSGADPIRPLHEGKLKVVAWPSVLANGKDSKTKSCVRSQGGAQSRGHILPGLLDAEASVNDDFLKHVDFDLSSGQAVFRNNLEWAKRRFNSLGDADSPTAEFADPEETTAALEELVYIFRRFHGDVRVVCRYQPPAQGFQSDDHKNWLIKLLSNRAAIVRVELEELGIPGELLSVRMEKCSDDCAPTMRFEYDTTAQVRHVAVYIDRIECFAHCEKHEHQNPCTTFPADLIRCVRLVDDGFSLSFPEGGVFQVELVCGDDLDMWVDALRELAEHIQRNSDRSPRRIAPQVTDTPPEDLPPPPDLTSCPRGVVREQPAPAEDRPRQQNVTAIPFFPDSDNDNFTESRPTATEEVEKQAGRLLESIDEPVIMRGFLGFKTRAGLTTRYAVLFKDRLDAWDRHSDISVLDPAVCVPIKDLASLESASEGLVLNIKDLKLQLHIPTGPSTRLWKQALLFLMGTQIDGNDRLDFSSLKAKAKQPKKPPKSVHQRRPSPARLRYPPDAAKSTEGPESNAGFRRSSASPRRLSTSPRRLSTCPRAPSVSPRRASMPSPPSPARRSTVPSPNKASLAQVQSNTLPANPNNPASPRRASLHSRTTGSLQARLAIPVWDNSFGLKTSVDSCGSGSALGSARCTRNSVTSVGLTGSKSGPRCAGTGKRFSNVVVKDNSNGSAQALGFQPPRRSGMSLKGDDRDPSILRRNSRANDPFDDNSQGHAPQPRPSSPAKLSGVASKRNSSTPAVVGDRRENPNSFVTGFFSQNTATKPRISKDATTRGSVTFSGLLVSKSGHRSRSLPTGRRKSHGDRRSIF